MYVHGFAWIGRRSISRSVFPDHKQGFKQFWNIQSIKRTAWPVNCPSFSPASRSERGGKRGKKKTAESGHSQMRDCLQSRSFQNVHINNLTEEKCRQQSWVTASIRGKTLRNKTMLSERINKRFLFCCCWDSVSEQSRSDLPWGLRSFFPREWEILESMKGTAVGQRQSMSTGSLETRADWVKQGQIPLQSL